MQQAGDLYIYSQVPYNNVLAIDGPHLQWWSHEIITELKICYHLVFLLYLFCLDTQILTIVLQLPTVFSILTSCTGL